MTTPTPPKNHFTLGGYAAKQCPTRAQNDYDPEIDPADQDPDDPFSVAIMAAGNEYEDQIRVQLCASFRQFVVIDTQKKMGKVVRNRTLENARLYKLVVFEGDRSHESLALREDLTHALAENPGQVRLLWNPRLRKWKKDGRGRAVWTDRSAEPDLLYRQNVRVAKSPRWSSIDVKFHNPFEGEAAGLAWSLSPLKTPYPEKSVQVPWTGILKKVDAYQLAHYHRALEFHGLAGSPIAGIIGKPLDGETRVVWADLNDKLYERGTTSALAMYDKAFSRVVAIVEREIARKDDPTLPHLSSPEWKQECKTCPWQTVCHDKMSVEDHISLLPGVTPAKLEAHYNAGITTVAQMAKLDVLTASLVEAGVVRLHDVIVEAKESTHATDTLADVLGRIEVTPREVGSITAKLTAAGLISAAQLAQLDLTTARYEPGTKGLVKNIDQARVEDFARVRRTTSVFQARGVENLVIPSAPVEIHVDMENDEHIYLWGMYTNWHYKGGRVRRDYHAFVSWEGTNEGEARAFSEFWSGLMSMIDKARAQEGENGVRVFHYSPAEDRCMRHLAEEYAGQPGIPTLDEVNAFLASDTWVDLYPVLATQFVWPCEDMTLKSLAKYVLFVWRDDDPSGSNSVVWYQLALDESQPEHDKWRTRILEYNEDDCRATAALLEWLQKIGAVNTVGKKIGRVEDLERRYLKRR
jgi:predicted RecB family nuclease